MRVAGLLMPSENCSKMSRHVRTFLQLLLSSVSCSGLNSVFRTFKLLHCEICLKMWLASTSRGSQWQFKSYASCCLEVVHEAVSKSQFSCRSETNSNKPAAKTLILNVPFASPINVKGKILAACVCITVDFKLAMSSVHVPLFYD